MYLQTIVKTIIKIDIGPIQQDFVTITVKSTNTVYLDNIKTVVKV